MQNEEKEKNFTSKELRWDREVGVYDFTDEEMLELIAFAQSLIIKKNEE